MLEVESRVLYRLESSFPTTPESVHLLIFCLLSVWCLLLLLVYLFCFEAGFELLIFLPPPPKSWDYRHLPPRPCPVPLPILNFEIITREQRVGKWYPGQHLWQETFPPSLCSGRIYVLKTISWYSFLHLLSLASLLIMSGINQSYSPVNIPSCSDTH